jgi:hypothetical protein
VATGGGQWPNKMSFGKSLPLLTAWNLFSRV